MACGDAAAEPFSMVKGSLKSSGFSASSSVGRHVVRLVAVVPRALVIAEVVVP